MDEMFEILSSATSAVEALRSGVEPIVVFLWCDEVAEKFTWVDRDKLFDAVVVASKNPDDAMLSLW